MFFFKMHLFMLGGFFAISKFLPPPYTTTTTTIPALYYNFFSLFSSILKYKRSLYWQKKILNTHDEPKIIYNSSPLLFFPLSLSYLLCPKEEKKIQNNILLYTKFIFFSFQKISTTAHKYTHYTDTLVANLILSF